MQKHTWRRDAAARRRFRPGAEVLEDRLVLSFTPAAPVPVGGLPRSVAVGDFNHDGRQDLAVANYSSNSVSVGLGNGQGGFAVMPNVAAVNEPASVAIGDFNGDGQQDLAVAGDSTTVRIRWGHATEVFGESDNLSAGASPRFVTAADFNGDGRADLAVANPANNAVSVRLGGSGLGGFTNAPDVPAGNAPLSVAAADFNSDGRPDLAVANYNGGSDAVGIRLGNGQGGFAVAPDIPVSSFPFSLAVGGFNSDGRPDLAVANGGSNTVTILLNAFPTPTPAPRPLTVALVAVKKRGKPPRLKVVVRYADTGEIKAQFNSPFQRSAYRKIAALALDINGDGTADGVQITAVKVGLRKKTVKRVIPV